MKQLLVSLFCGVLIIGSTGCLKSEKPCTARTISSEDATITAYATANGYAMTKHSSGVYYQVINAGSSGVFPTGTSKVFVTYTGKLLDGTVFDSQSNSAATGWVLNTLIQGWQYGLPLIMKGGTIRLIVPSSLAYGCQANGSIPANSILYFDITLVDVQ
jgi:FKBP-type peptidyl-prolyl cis-trans isomerase FkpA